MRAHVAHRTPGRLRLKIPAARSDAAFFAQLREGLLGVEGVLDVTVSPLAASVVIVHDRGVDPLDVCRDVPALSIGPQSASRPRVARDNHPVGNTEGMRTEAALILLKLLPLAFARHPLAQLAEILAEPMLRVLVQALTASQSGWPTDAVGGQGEEPISLGA